MHCGMQDIQQPHKNLNKSNHVNPGENAVINPNNNRNVDDITKDFECEELFESPMFDQPANVPSNCGKQW